MKLFSEKRRGIYIFFKHVRDINKLQKYGNVITVSKKHRYIYLYIDDKNLNKTIEELQNKKFVTRVVKSELVDLSLDFIERKEFDLEKINFEN